MQRGVWPIRNAFDMPMLDRIEMDVVHMPLQVVSVANGVFPEPALPDATLAIASTTNDHTIGAQARGEAGLDQPPTHRVAIIAFWKSPDAVQVIGKDHDSVGTKGMPLAHQRIGVTQAMDVVDKQACRAIAESQCEEICRAGCAIATIDDHASECQGA